MTGMSRISRIFKIDTRDIEGYRGISRDIEGYRGMSRDVKGNGVNDKEECLRTLKK